MAFDAWEFHCIHWIMQHARRASLYMSATCFQLVFHVAAQYMLFFEADSLTFEHLAKRLGFIQVLLAQT